MIALYWDLGRIIVLRQTDSGWGKSDVERLSIDLQQEFPGISGFSSSNLWRRRVFYKTYEGKKKLAPLVREICWSHNLMIFERCNDFKELEFYISMTAKYGWSKNILAIKIQDKTYEAALLSQTNFDTNLPDTNEVGVVN